MQAPNLGNLRLSVVRILLLGHDLAVPGRAVPVDFGRSPLALEDPAPLRRLVARLAADRLAVIDIPNLGIWPRLISVRAAAPAVAQHRVWAAREQELGGVCEGVRATRRESTGERAKRAPDRQRQNYG